MANLATIYEKDVYPDRVSEQGIVFTQRPTVKAIVADDEGNIALVGRAVHGFFTLPGGGIDEGESTEEALIRECIEEIQCRVVVGARVGTIDDYRNRDGRHFITECYLATVARRDDSMKLTDDEAKHGFYVKWLPKEEALSVLRENVRELKEKREIGFYNMGFDVCRDRLFLEAYAKGDFPQSKGLNMI